MNLLTLRYFSFRRRLIGKIQLAAWCGGKLLNNGVVLKSESNGCELSAAVALGVASVGYRNSSRALLLLHLQMS